MALKHLGKRESLGDCVWFGLVWFGLVWFGLVWFGLVWSGCVEDSFFKGYFQLSSVPIFSESPLL